MFKQAVRAIGRHVVKNDQGKRFLTREVIPDISERSSKVLYSQPSQFNKAVFVSENENWRMLSFGDLPHITLLQGKVRLVNSGNTLDFTGRCEYINTMISSAISYSACLRDLEFLPNNTRILSIGLGVGSIPTFFQRHYSMVPIHVVEIDPKVVESAELCFGLDTKHVKVFCEDAREYLKRNQGRSQYDIVFLDVFGPSGIPDDLVSIEFVKQLSSIMKSSGVVVANIHGDIKVFNQIVDSFKATFKTLHMLGVKQESNTVLIGYQEDRISIRKISDTVETIASQRSFDFDIRDYLLHSLATADYNP